jgi:hypothetical protein
MKKLYYVLKKYRNVICKKFNEAFTIVCIFQFFLQHSLKTLKMSKYSKHMYNQHFSDPKLVFDGQTEP